MSIYDSLNEAQKEAVFTTEGPVLCLAGAGSGKTRVLTNRVAYLIEQGVKPYNIMAITFTNKAAGEMKERVMRIVGDGAESVWITTFHSSCVRILRRFADRIGYDTNFSIYDADDSKSVMKNVCKKLSIDTKILKERTILSAISSAKDELIPPDEYRITTQGDYRLSKIADAYDEYQETLKKNNAMDFDDLIVNTVRLLKEDPEVLDSYQKRFLYVMVDEYQDTNTAQFNLIRLLSDGTRNLCVVGDDDQSIYKFRGANIRNILDFEKFYPEAKTIRLEQNYRSTQNILDAANAVISNNKGRKDKSLFTDKGNGSLIHLRQFDNAFEEAEFIADDVQKKSKKAGDYSSCAVLYRTNAQSRLLEERFVYEGIPYRVVGGVNFYSRREIKDILAYLKTINNARDDMQVIRIINVPKRGIGATTVEKIRMYASSIGVSFFDAMQDEDLIKSLGKTGSKIKAFVNLISVFRAKLEVSSLDELVRYIINETDYLSEFDGDTDEEIDARAENLDEFINKIVAFMQNSPDATLSDLLNEVSLVADIDEVTEDVPRALLMTLHSAKGLEFDNVYLAGMEDGLFPSDMTISSDDPMDIEEERRLAYVGITRAKTDLTITYAKTRMVRGETHFHALSRFAREIPVSLMDSRPERSSYTEDMTAPKQREERTFTHTSKKPYVAAGGLDFLKEAGITKGMPQGNGGLKIGERPDYDIGDRVSHIRYGEGTVTDLEPGARDYKVTVDFDDHGVKAMYAAFAKLIKVT